MAPAAIGSPTPNLAAVGAEPTPPQPGLAVYDPADHPADIVAIQVSAFALLALLGAAGSRRARIAQAATATAATAGAASAGLSGRQAGELVSTEVESADEGLGGELAVVAALGDRSWTWRWPGTATVDRLSIEVPPKLAPRSPLLARVLNDAGYLRAMAGSASVLVPVLGAVLAVLAVADVHGEALPPSIWLAAALALIGVFDAFAGVVSVAVFVTGVVLLGGVSSADAARTLLGLATLWFAAPLIAGTARPLRRPPTMTLQEHWDRTADVVIASLVGAWAVKVILEGLPGLSGLDLPIADAAGAVALLVLAALAVRMVLETAAAHWYPWRLSRVQPEELGEPGNGQRLAAHALVLGVFVFVAVSYVGMCWQLVVGGALFVLPKLLGLVSDHLPTSRLLHKVTPHGIVEIVFALFVGAVTGAVVLAHFSGGEDAIRASFVLLSLPGLALALLELFGEGPERELSIRHQLLGIPLLAFGVLLALGVIVM